MKFLVFVVLLVLVQCSVQEEPELTEKEKKAIETCAKEVHVEPKVLEAMEQGNFLDDPNLKCFIKCTMVKMDHMSEAGVINWENVKKETPPSEVTAAEYSKAVESCQNVKGADPCDLAFNVFKCLDSNLE